MDVASSHRFVFCLIRLLWVHMLSVFLSATFCCATTVVSTTVLPSCCQCFCRLLSQDVSLAIKFLPELMSFMVDGTLHQVLQKLKEPTTMPFTTSLKTYISKQQPMLILCSYTCVLAEQKDFSNLVQLLPMIASVFSTQDVQLPDGFIHHIGLLMCGAVDAMQDSQVRTILREFYLPCSCSDEGFLYACHYLCLVSEKVDKEFLDEVLGLMETESQVSSLVQSESANHSPL